MLDFGNSTSNSEVSKSNSNIIFSGKLRNYVTSEGAVSRTLFYTINSSPLLVTKKVFMITVILSNYPIQTILYSAVKKIIGTEIGCLH